METMSYNLVYNLWTCKMYLKSFDYVLCLLLLKHDSCHIEAIAT